MKNGINLIPDEVRKERLMKKARSLAAVAAALYLAALLSVIGLQRSWIKEKAGELAAIEARRDELLGGGRVRTDLGASLAAARAAEAELARRISAAASVPGRKIAWSHVLKRLSAEVPEGVWLRSLSTSDAAPALKRVRLSGSATSNRPIAGFISRLENSGVFTDVSLKYTQKREQAAYDFELYMDLDETGEGAHER